MSLFESYKKYAYLVDDIFQECLGSGLTKSAAAGKTKYELLPMPKLPDDKRILYFLLCDLFAKEQLEQSFFNMYRLLKEEFGPTDFFEWTSQHNELLLLSEEIYDKQKTIRQYAVGL